MEERPNTDGHAMEKQSKVDELEQAIADLRARMPAHSVSAAMLQELEELEEQLEAERKKLP